MTITAEGNDNIPLLLIEEDDDKNLVIQDRLLNRTVVFTEAQAKELYRALDVMHNEMYNQDPNYFKRGE